jgi:hypothetical protein
MDIELSWLSTVVRLETGYWMYDIIRKHRSKGQGGVWKQEGPNTGKDRVGRKVEELGYISPQVNVD